MPTPKKAQVGSTPQINPNSISLVHRSNIVQNIGTAIMPPPQAHNNKVNIIGVSGIGGSGVGDGGGGDGGIGVVLLVVFVVTPSQCHTGNPTLNHKWSHLHMNEDNNIRVHTV